MDNGKINRETGMINRSFVLRMENRRRKGKKNIEKEGFVSRWLIEELMVFFFSFQRNISTR